MLKSEVRYIEMELGFAVYSFSYIRPRGRKAGAMLSDMVSCFDGGADVGESHTHGGVRGSRC